MQFQLYTPHIALQPYVQGIVYTSTDARKNNNLQRIDFFPVGSSYIAFVLRESAYFQSSQQAKDFVRFNFMGQIEQHQHVITSSLSLVYVLFRPHGAYRLLGIPQDLLTNACSSLNTLLGHQINEVLAKLEDQSHDHLAVLRILQEWLLMRLGQNTDKQSGRVSFICQKIMAHSGTLPIKELNRMSCMSKRSMEQYFKEQVGLSPKTFSRIIRFNQAYKQLQNSEQTDWMEIVERFDYFDQSHFIHEFKRFFGYTPSQRHLSTENSDSAGLTYPSF
ncbi:helix-turn-helix transcriptional regulator [Parapedobacter sp. SGR-10]|uniref:helix-turn-helix domain-containing protein n=1 Tax=Parapedobacter sp. SGR-10 TaxID=2710879 RepID=UPI0013D189D4|nr:AraC family transcriptional regulator [Parapedobacter sp. SGR-10]NGF57039.1 helix-turn-helix transcriptional regulator [Parapedobacter sp. SGR-10]